MTSPTITSLASSNTFWFTPAPSCLVTTSYTIPPITGDLVFTPNDIANPAPLTILKGFESFNSPCFPDGFGYGTSEGPPQPTDTASGSIYVTQNPLSPATCPYGYLTQQGAENSTGSVTTATCCPKFVTLSRFTSPADSFDSGMTYDTDDLLNTASLFNFTSMMKCHREGIWTLTLNNGSTFTDTGNVFARQVVVTWDTNDLVSLQLGSGPTTTSTSTTIPSTTTPTPTLAGPTTSAAHDSGLSSGAAAGIGVGVTLGVIALLLGVGFLWWRRRSRAKNARTVPQSEVQQVSHYEDSPRLSSSAYQRASYEPGPKPIEADDGRAERAELGN